MSKSYTPGLKVLRNTRIVKERKLPLKGTVNASVDQDLKSTDIVASTSLPGNIHMINVANQLNIDPSSINDFVKVSIDQKVEKGEVLAENNGFFGFLKSQVLSPLDGNISNISNTTGQIMISEPDIPVEIDAYIDGKVVEVIKDEGVILESRGSFIQGIIGVGGEKKGDISVIEDKSKENDFKDKIIVIKGSIDEDTYREYSKLGASGIVAGGFDYNSLSNILGYKLGVAITGTESIDTTLMVTEGFGDVQMSDKTYNILKEHNGKYASINGATQIRAGVIRPELVISLNDNADNCRELSEGDLIIQEGSKVRVIRQPYFGLLGTVVSLPKDPVSIESETKARVAEIEFSNNERKLVPRANLEIILE